MIARGNAPIAFLVAGLIVAAVPCALAQQHFDYSPPADVNRAAFDAFQKTQAWDYARNPNACKLFARLAIATAKFRDKGTSQAETRQTMEKAIHGAIAQARDNSPIPNFPLFPPTKSVDGTVAVVYAFPKLSTDQLNKAEIYACYRDLERKMGSYPGTTF